MKLEQIARNHADSFCDFYSNDDGSPPNPYDEIIAALCECVMLCADVCERDITYFQNESEGQRLLRRSAAIRALLEAKP